jgi:hypothetical protein
MQEAVEAIQAAGGEVFAFAPSAEAGRGVLREVGFAEADTVARLLHDANLQKQIEGGTLWIDEAGQLGSRSLAAVFELAEARRARVVLSGDRRQHGAVERGSVLRLLETEAGLVPAELTEIQRQRGAYKQAVQRLSQGDVLGGFQELDRLGWIRELPQPERNAAIAADYVAAIAAGKSALVVSPTHREGEPLAAAIRAALQERGRLSRDEQSVGVLVSRQLTEAERADPQQLQSGDVLEFHLPAPGRRRGARLTVEAGAPPPVEVASRYQVYQRRTLALAAGDWIRITKNGRTADGAHRLHNGSRHRLRGFTAAGDLRLENGWTIARDWGHLTQGYVTTSHSSQGKTVDRVFIAQSSASLAASSREQFYVSASRAREQATIYTDDRAALQAAVARSEEQLTAVELVDVRRMNPRPFDPDPHDRGPLTREPARIAEEGRHGR